MPLSGEYQLCTTDFWARLTQLSGQFTYSSNPPLGTRFWAFKQLEETNIMTLNSIIDFDTLIPFKKTKIKVKIELQLTIFELKN